MGGYSGYVAIFNLYTRIIPRKKQNVNKTKCQRRCSFKRYRPYVTGTIELPEGVEMVMPGDNVKIDVKLITPVAMEEGLRFAIREGGRTVGSGVVSKIKK